MEGLGDLDGTRGLEVLEAGKGLEAWKGLQAWDGLKASTLINGLYISFGLARSTARWVGGFWLAGALENYILGTLDLLKNDFVFGRLWHSPFIFPFSCLG